jgi:hypothetical protein
VPRPYLAARAARLSSPLWERASSRISDCEGAKLAAEGCEAGRGVILSTDALGDPSPASLALTRSLRTLSHKGRGEAEQAAPLTSDDEVEAFWRRRGVS